LKKNKKFIYLISPRKIKNKKFYSDLVSIFKSKKISFFQLRLKKESSKKIINIGKKIKKICKKFNVKLIINDNPFLAKKINADGCHIGQSDSTVSESRKILKNKIIGITCHNSKKLIKKAVIDRADYIALGAFYSTKTKKVKFRAKIKLIKEAKKITKIPIVAIGGINLSNYKKLLLNKANFLAISSYIWNNKKYKPLKAILKLK
jgi:thiamine-phosphate pyrophosphorylase